MVSEDEVFVLMIALGGAVISWGNLFRQAYMIQPYRFSLPARLPVFIALGLSVVALNYVVAHWSSYDVGDSRFYTFFYLVMGVAWLALCRPLLNGLNLRIRDDVLERSNLASSLACGGALLGMMACFAGGNVGDGPGWWVVVYSAGLATLTASVAWLILDAITGLIETVSVERDIAAGVRAGAFWLGAGLILGRAVAGNWVSSRQTDIDFVVYGWPVLILLVIAIPMEWAVRARVNPARSSLVVHGLFPAAAYVAIGLGSVIGFGQP